MRELRERLSNPDATYPAIEPLVVWLKGFEPACDSPYFIWNIDVDGVSGSYVILKLRFNSVTKFVAAFMPTFNGSSQGFHQFMLNYSKQQGGKSFSLPKLPSECWTDERKGNALPVTQRSQTSD